MAIMKKMLLLLSVFTAISADVWAQNEDTPKLTRKEERRQRSIAISRQEEEGVITYRKHFAFGAKLHNDGYGGFFEIGRAKSPRKGLLFQLDIMERKHHKEEKINVSFFSSSPVIYGKINYFYPVKLGAQYTYLLGNKTNKNGVSITANLGGGVSLGMLRPYKVTVVDPNGGYKSIRYQDDSALFVGGVIVEGPNFGSGWNQMKVVPGFYAKPAVRFDYGKSNEMVSALEVGLHVEYYTKEIEQMIFRDPRSLFVSGYVAIMFGKRK